MVVTEASWFKPNPPQVVVDFWAKGYPGMGTVEENIQKIEKQGYKLIEHFPLPDSSWWESYFDPLAERVSILREKYAKDAEAQGLLDGTHLEMVLFRKYSSYFGYEFYIAQKT